MIHNLPDIGDIVLYNSPGKLLTPNQVPATVCAVKKTGHLDLFVINSQTTWMGFEYNVPWGNLNGTWRHRFEPPGVFAESHARQSEDNLDLWEPDLNA